MSPGACGQIPPVPSETLAWAGKAGTHLCWPRALACWSMASQLGTWGCACQGAILKAKVHTGSQFTLMGPLGRCVQGWRGLGLAIAWVQSKEPDHGGMD